MTRFGEHALWLEFTSDRFDRSSEPPVEYNAGNRFYGRDVAEFLSTGLAARGLGGSFFDEDWGWLVHARVGDERVLEVVVYHNPEGDPGTHDEWALLVRSLRRGKWLGLLPRFTEVEVDGQELAALEDVFREGEIPLRHSRR